MSQQLGRILTCDRCGKTVFESVREAEGDEGWKSDTLYFERAEGWVEPSDYSLRNSKCNNHKTLCPECEATRKDVMSRFWSNEQALEDNLKGEAHET